MPEDSSEGGTYETNIHAPTEVQAWQKHDVNQTTEWNDMSRSEVNWEQMTNDNSITDIVNKRIVDVQTNSNEDNDVTMVIYGDSATKAVFQPHSGKSNREVRKYVTWGIIGGVIIVCVVVGYFFFSRKKKDEDRGNSRRKTV